MSKIFIVGLPRTGTTSLCVFFVNLGYKTAHCAYSYHTFEEAEVIADTPVFANYKQLDLMYPDAKFIYLDRDLTGWLPSVKKLFASMSGFLLYQRGNFDPLVKQCYQTVFSFLSEQNIQSDQYLQTCYQRHQQEVFDYFSDRKNDFIAINLSIPSDAQKLVQFLGLNLLVSKFPHVNRNGAIQDWVKNRHPLIVPSRLR